MTVNTQSPGVLIPTNFLGLSFETANLQSNGVNVAGYMFDSSDTELVTLSPILASNTCASAEPPPTQ